MFEIREDADKIPDFFLGRHIGKKGIKPAKGKLGRIPRFVEHINGEEAKL